MHFDTLTIHGSKSPDPAYGAVMTPVYLSSTYAFKKVGEPGPYDYARSGNPTRAELEDTLARLDGGVKGFAFTTGMAAEATVLALLSAGDHLIVHDDLYGGTYRLVTEVCHRQGIAVEFVNLRNDLAFRAAIRPNTKAVWFESVTNPLLNVIDVEPLVRVCRERKILTICDNTFLSPSFFRPLSQGVDIVLHSTTKYINGHSDVVGGAIVVSEPELAKQVGFLQNALGTCASPFDCFLVLRGIRSLPLRMARHHESALAIAEWLQKHPKVSKVHHPGLASHSDHALASRQFSGYGGTFSFRISGGVSSVRNFLEALKLFTLAESLGGVESLVEHPWTMTHVAMPEAVRVKTGITDDLVRISIGLEHVSDLIADLQQAFNAS
jgi:cystathionine beta-lyase/cystathionine gamma-synthase